MPWQRIAFGLSWVAVLLLSARSTPAAPVELDTDPQEKTIPATDTDWGPGTPGITNPLVFDKFDPSLGILVGVDLTLAATIHNSFIIQFNRLSPTKIIVSTSTDPLGDTGGPIVALGVPGSSSPIDSPIILVEQPVSQRVVDLSDRTAPLPDSEINWSSLFPDTNPNFLEPTNSTTTISRTLTASDAVFSQFIGPGTIEFPVAAMAHSSFFTDSGNGAGTVLTTANAVVTLQYHYLIPEPSSAVLVGLGMGVCLVVGMVRRRAAVPAENGPA